MKPLSRESVIGVIGAGTMGAGIAQVAASYGHRVILFDQNPDAVQRGIDQIDNGLSKLLRREKISAAEHQAILARLQPAAELAALADCQLVVEAIIENLDIKRQLLKQLEAICSDSCILASNTSSISITALAAEMQHPRRLLGMHFFNPAPVMKLVEVVSGIATDPDIAGCVHATASAWGKQAVHAKSTPGFIVNRVARPFYAEGLRLLEEGAADVATLDALIRTAGGFRMGPFELMDLIGHDVNYAVTCSVFDACYQDPRFLPSLTQKALVDSRRLGRKSGCGFYDYGNDVATPSPATAAAVNRPPASINVCGDLGPAEPLIDRIRDAGITVNRQSGIGSEGYIRVGSALLALTDGRFASERAAVEDQPELVLFDLALNYRSTERLAIAVADQCSEEAREDAIGLLQALDIAVSQLDDVPGLVLMRTVAMLASEAADAVNQGVCSAADADTAMRGGVNYPQGPLAWADSVGPSRIFNCLSNLQQSYGEDRYRPSPLLRRKHFAGGRFF